MKHFIVAMLLLITIPVLHAQSQHSISGTIKGKNGLPISDAHVYLKATNYGTSTNQNGFYNISSIPQGSYTVLVSEVGYKTYTSNTIVVNGAVTLDILLDDDVSALSDVVVSSNSISKYVEDTPSESLKLQEKINLIPQNIQVISGEVLQDQQIISIMENVTRNVSGAQMIEHWGNFARINMRGFRIPPFRNGMNVLSNWGPMAEDMAMVDRIEVVKGPSAFMLSSGEPGGLYNVVTKKPTGAAHREIGLTTGSYNTLRATLDVEGKLTEDNKLQYRFVGAGTMKESHRAYEPENRYTFAPSIKYQIDDKTSITGQYTYQYYKTKLIGSAYVFAPDEYASLDRDFTLSAPNLGPSIMKEHYGFVNFNRQLSDHWTLTAQLSYLNYGHTGSSLWIDSSFGLTEDGDLLRSISIWDAKEEQKMGQVFLTGTAQTGGISHKILAGLDLGNKNYIADWSQNVTIDNADNPFNIYNPQAPAVLPVFDRSTPLDQRASGILTSQYLSYYIQDQLGFFENKLRITLAGRLTDYQSSSYGATTDDQVFTPRVAASYSILENLSAYAMYDQSFLPQTGTDRNGNAFDPVDASDVEGGLKYEFLGGKWNVAADYYVITKSNSLTADPEDNNYSIQLGETTSKGFEFDLRGELLKGLNVVLNYSNTLVEITKDTNDENEGTPVPGFSKHITNGWFSYKFQQEQLQGLGVSLGYQYLADRSTWAWAADGKTDLPNYFRMDGGIFWGNDTFKISLNINNLLNEYLYSGADYGSYVYWQSEPGRNFRLSLDYKF